MAQSKAKRGTVPHEIVVQKLAFEPDNKQKYKPLKPREFVPFEYIELTLANLKSACAAHFRLPAASCDILVSDKGPSCTNISQILHRKDKVKAQAVHEVFCASHDSQELSMTIIFGVEGCNNFIHCGFLVDVVYIKIPHASIKLR